MDKPILTRIRQSRSYILHPKTKAIFGFYSVIAKWPDGRRKEFESEEHANAFVEGRPVNPEALKAETPAGYPEPEPAPAQA